MENLEIPKYEYYLKTWGGFYNNEYKVIHNLEPEETWFDTLEEREKRIRLLKDYSEKLGAHVLMVHKAEGYYTRSAPVLHRITEYKGEQRYHQYSLCFPDWEFSHASYHMEYKWTPGFNHYPFGEENIDYEEVKTVAEWITGSFPPNSGI